MVNCWLSNMLTALKEELNKRKEERSRAIVIGIINWLLDDNLKISDVWDKEIKGIKEEEITNDYLEEIKNNYHLKIWEFEELKLMVEAVKAI